MTRPFYLACLLASAAACGSTATSVTPAGEALANPATGFRLTWGDAGPVVVDSNYLCANRHVSEYSGAETGSLIYGCADANQAFIRTHYQQTIALSPESRAALDQALASVDLTAVPPSYTLSILVADAPTVTAAFQSAAGSKATQIPMGAPLKEVSKEMDALLSTISELGFLLGAGGYTPNSAL